MSTDAIIGIAAIVVTAAVIMFGLWAIAHLPFKVEDEEEGDANV